MQHARSSGSASPPFIVSQQPLSPSAPAHDFGPLWRAYAANGRWPSVHMPIAAIALAIIEAVVGAMHGAEGLAHPAALGGHCSDARARAGLRL